MNRFLPSIGAVALLALTLSAQSFPPGIRHEVLHTGLSQPVGLALLRSGPGDERFLFIEQSSGRVFAATPAGQRQQIGTVTGVNTSGNERGLLGVAVDPAFPTRPFVYFHLTSTGGDVRIIRHTLTGQLANPASLALSLGARYEVLTGMPDQRFNHNGGTVRFGPDGMLYASLGDDAANACNAQTTSDGRGIIFRMDVSGLPAGAGGPPAVSALRPAMGNPFTTGTYGPVTYAYGLRNPYRFNIDPVTGNLYVADVGQNAFEEFNEVTGPGQNFGWPFFEGNSRFSSSCPLNGTAVPPIVDVNQNQGWLSIVPLAGRYRNVTGGSRNLGAQYEGQVFYTDFFAGQVRRLEFSGGSWSNPAPVAGQTSATNWGTGMGGCADSIIDSEGGILYCDLTAGLIGRISGDPNAAIMSVVSDGGVGNAGQALPAPVTVRLASVAGTPIAGRTVTWSASGAVSVSAASSVTDANGEASVTATLASTFTGAPVVTATSGNDTIAVRPTWRGVTQTTIPNRFVVLSVRHSAASSPIAVAIDIPRPNPLLSTPFGDIWTSVFSAQPTALILDGTGLFGGADPTLVTSAAGNWTRLFDISGLPAGGLQLMVQAYGIDSAFPLNSPESIFISNELLITLP